MKDKKEEKLPNRFTAYYLIDLANGTYEEYTGINLQKKLDRSPVFIRHYDTSGEIFIINGRGYKITSDFGEVWNLI